MTATAQHDGNENEIDTDEGEGLEQPAQDPARPATVAQAQVGLAQRQQDVDALVPRVRPRLADARGSPARGAISVSSLATASAYIGTEAKQVEGLD